MGRRARRFHVEAVSGRREGAAEMLWLAKFRPDAAAAESRPEADGAGPERDGLAAAGESAWIAEACRGSEMAVELLFRRYWNDAHRAAYLIVRDAAAAEDIAQEAFMAALRSLDRFDRHRPFGPWFHRIVANRSIDWARARAARHEVAAELVDPALGASGPPEIDPFQRAQLLGALADLPPEQRAVVCLRYLFDYTPGEIAGILDLPRGTINSRMRRALDRLAADLGPERGELGAQGDDLAPEGDGHE